MITYLPIGKTLKMHGVQGHLKMSIAPKYQESFESIKVLFIEKSGKKTPFFVEKIDTISGLYLVKLEDVDTKEAAQPISNKPLFAREGDITEAEVEIEEEDALAQFVGFQIIDQNDQIIGRIEEVKEFPQQIMAFVNHQDEEVMIPLNEAFIESIDPKTKEIIMTLPEGLLDLQ